MQLNVYEATVYISKRARVYISMPYMNAYVTFIFYLENNLPFEIRLRVCSQEHMLSS